MVAMSRVSQILESRDLFKDCMYMLHLHSKELLKTLLKGIVLLDGWMAGASCRTRDASILGGQWRNFHALVISSRLGALDRSGFCGY